MASAAQAVPVSGHTSSVPATARLEVAITRRRLAVLSSIHCYPYKTYAELIEAQPPSRASLARLLVSHPQHLSRPAVFLGPGGRTRTFSQASVSGQPSRLETRNCWCSYFGRT
jgi:hypothetical protein